MIRARLTNGSFVFGIDEENIKRLKRGMPLAIDLQPMGGADRFLILYGPTMHDIVTQLEEATGEKLPPASPWKPDEGTPS